MLQPLGSDPLGEVSDPQTEEYASINAENKLAPDTLLDIDPYLNPSAPGLQHAASYPTSHHLGFNGDGAPEPALPPQRPDPKKQICFDFTKNQCSRGYTCKFSHDLQHIIQVNSQEKGICFDFLKGACTRGPLCRFSHDLRNLHAVPFSSPQSTGVMSRPSAPICYDFVKSQCNRGDECRYSHDYTSILTAQRNTAKNPYVVCMDFVRGRCARGATCRYVHGDPGAYCNTPHGGYQSPALTAAAASMMSSSPADAPSLNIAYARALLAASNALGGAALPDVVNRVNPMVLAGGEGGTHAFNQQRFAEEPSSKDYASLIRQLQGSTLEQSAQNQNNPTGFSRPDNLLGVPTAFATSHKTTDPRHLSSPVANPTQDPSPLSMLLMAQQQVGRSPPSPQPMLAPQPQQRQFSVPFHHPLLTKAKSEAFRTSGGGTDSPTIPADWGNTLHSGTLRRSTPSVLGDTHVSGASSREADAPSSPLASFFSASTSLPKDPPGLDSLKSIWSQNP